MSTDPVNANANATPRPGLPRTIGVLNLLVGGFLLVVGGWLAESLRPFLRENTPLRFDPATAQAVADGLREQLASDVRAQERAAKSQAEKDALRKARLELQAKTTRIVEQVDFDALNRDIYWVSPYLWADFGSGPALNALLVVSGFGLLGLKEWGRKLAVWTAALKVVRLVLLSGFLGGVVVPNFGRAIATLGKTDAGERVLRGALGLLNQTLGTSVTLTPLEIVQDMNWVGYGYAVLVLGFGAIYPAVVLLVLTRPGAARGVFPEVMS